MLCLEYYVFPFLFPSNVPHSLNSILKKAQTAKKQGGTFLEVPLPAAALVSLMGREERMETCLIPFLAEPDSVLQGRKDEMKLAFGIRGARRERMETCFSPSLAEPDAVLQGRKEVNETCFRDQGARWE